MVGFNTMQIPSSTVQSYAAKRQVIYTRPVCGFLIGTLDVPAVSIEEIVVDGINVDEYAECPIRVSLPPPIIYASSSYPVYGTESVSIGIGVISASIHTNTYYTFIENDNVSFGVDLLQGKLRESVIEKTILPDSCGVYLNITSITEARVLYPPTQVDMLAASCSFSDITSKSYRYIEPSTSVVDVKTSLNLESAFLDTFGNYLIDVLPDSVQLQCGIITISSKQYRWESLPDVDDATVISCTIISGELNE